ncbi:hypothetical protein KIW84_056943 [Lathyrus oleraceus]|uniref:Gamma tubulin complex component protein N-terminal domain-containing protein n=1 Tax=Pisum sativum TaxID=3888 RepID=A0A9D5AHG8_PEA|nr:hypothetical protein KIW84_056943 [Pisum sativum]
MAGVLYHDSDVIMLDDVLSAVDVQVAQWILHNAILGPLMKGKTRLLCTHNIQAISSVDMVVVLDKGHVKWMGSSADFPTSSYTTFSPLNEMDSTSHNHQQTQDTPNIATIERIHQPSHIGDGSAASARQPDGTAPSSEGIGSITRLASIDSFDSKWQQFLDPGESVLMISMVKKFQKNLQARRVYLSSCQLPIGDITMLLQWAIGEVPELDYALPHLLQTTGELHEMLLLEKMTQCASRAYMSILERWVYEGVIDDPYGEIFIAEDKSFQKESLTRDYDAKYWRQRYSLKDALGGTCNTVMIANISPSTLSFGETQKHPSLG